MSYNLRAQYDDGCKGTSDIDMSELLWQILSDIQHSYRIAMAGKVPLPVINSIDTEVNDYLVNNYGDL